MPETAQVQPTHMTQGPRTSAFIFNKLINIVFGYIFSLQSEPSLLYGKSAKDNTLLVFYMDNIFKVFKTYKKQLIFLCDHFFQGVVWSRLKFVFSKLIIGITKIFILDEEYEIDGRVRLKSNKIEKIFTWLVSQD